MTKTTLFKYCFQFDVLISHSPVLRFGRRIPYCTFMLIGGAAGMLVLAVPNKVGK